MTIDPKKQSYKENYKLMIGSIVPRPIAFVSTVSGAGIYNVAPFSFFTGITSKPPTVCFAPTRRGTDGAVKDTLQNIRDTGAFVINIVNEDIVEAMNNAATEFPPEYDEFSETGLTPAASERVAAPRVAESPINMECTLMHELEIGPAEPGGGFLVIGEIVLFHIRDDLLRNGRIDTAGLNPVGRLAGAEYTKLGERFTLTRKPFKKR